MSNNATKKAMNLLVYRQRSEKELYKKLEDTGFEVDEIVDAINYVKSFGYINDRRFAEAYVMSYQGRKSRSIMKSELRSKGVDDEYIEEALTLVPSDEKEIIMELLMKKSGTPHILDQKEYRRVSGFLARKGYAGSDISNVIRRYQNMCEAYE